MGVHSGNLMTSFFKGHRILDVISLSLGYYICSGRNLNGMLVLLIVII